MSVSVTTDTRCPTCGSRELLRVDLSIEQQPMAFTTCPHCESRWWERDGNPLPLEAVLKAVGRK
jgi:DNA-directed RNA polymerase subunit RPC12/RpoP